MRLFTVYAMNLTTQAVYKTAGYYRTDNEYMEFIRDANKLLLRYGLYYKSEPFTDADIVLLRMTGAIK